MDSENSNFRKRVAHLTLGGGFLICAVGSCVGQVGISVGTVGDGVALALLSLGLGVPLMLYGNATRGQKTTPVVANTKPNFYRRAPFVVLPATTEEFPGGGFDIPLETDPSLDLEITVVTGPPLGRPAPIEQWHVVEASSALFGHPSVGAA